MMDLEENQTLVRLVVYADVALPQELIMAPPLTYHMRSILSHIFFILHFRPDFDNLAPGQQRIKLFPEEKAGKAHYL